MRDFVSRTFARLFAVLGCSTLVTACYGVPYDTFDAKVSGTVTDAETAQPIKGILVRMTVGSSSQRGDNAVQSISPMASSRDVYTDDKGRFYQEIGVEGVPDGVLIECFDVDGSQNGTYLPESQVYPLETEEVVEISVDLKTN